MPNSSSATGFSSAARASSCRHRKRTGCSSTSRSYTATWTGSGSWPKTSRQAPRGESGTPAFGLELLPRAIAAFRGRHPDTAFEIETLHLEEINDALLETRIDIGLAFESLPSPGIEQNELATGRFVVVAPRDLDFNGKRALAIEDLKNLPFIGMNSRGPLGRSLSAAIEASGIDLDMVIRTETYHVAKSLVACGAGITITDNVTAGSAIASDVRVYPLEPAREFQIRALHLSEVPMSLLAKDFVAHLRRHIRAFLRQRFRD